MSRLGLRPLPIPTEVTVSLQGNTVQVTGPKGRLTVQLPSAVTVSMAEGAVLIRPVRTAELRTEDRALWGTAWALTRNALQGASQGSVTQLELHGVGYRAELAGKALRLFLGFTHPIQVEAPPSITFAVEKNIITVSGPDKAVVGEVAASIRRRRPPEPYKGKGIRYVGEIVRRKAGKVAGAATGAGSS